MCSGLVMMVWGFTLWNNGHAWPPVHLFKFRKRFGFSHTSPPKVLVGAENRIQGGVGVNLKKVVFFAVNILPQHILLSQWISSVYHFHSRVFARIFLSIFLIFKTEMSCSRAPPLGMWDAKGLVLLSINRGLFLWHCYTDTDREHCNQGDYILVLKLAAPLHS